MGRWEEGYYPRVEHFYTVVYFKSPIDLENIQKMVLNGNFMEIVCLLVQMERLKCY